MDMSSDTNRYNEIVTSPTITNFTETNVPDDQELASTVSDVNRTNSIVLHQQSAFDEYSTYPVEQSSIQHNIENGPSATNLEHNQHHQIIPHFNQTFSQWYSNSNDVFHPTSYSTTYPTHHQSDSSASLYRLSGNISEPILNTWGMENYGSAYSAYNQHLEPFNGAAYDTQNYCSEAASSNNFPLHPEQSVIQPTNVQRQIGDQQQMTSTSTGQTEFSTTLNRRRGNYHNRTQLRPKVHRCKVCSTGYTTNGHLKRHYNTGKHLQELKKQGSRSRFASV